MTQIRVPTPGAHDRRRAVLRGVTTPEPVTAPQTDVVPTPHRSQPGDELRQLARVREDAVRRYAERLSADEVASAFDAVVAEFDGARVRTFVGVLAQKRLRERLRATSAPV